MERAVSAERDLLQRPSVSSQDARPHRRNGVDAEGHEQHTRDPRHHQRMCPVEPPDRRRADDGHQDSIGTNETSARSRKQGRES
jgi:hypothetical protein